MKRIIAIVLLLALAAALVGCGGEPDPNLGVYEGVSGEYGGISVSVDSFFPGGFSLELKSGGKATLSVDGDSYNVRWSLDGEDLKIEAADTTLTGTLSEGVMVIENAIGSGVTLTLEKAD